MKKLIYTSLLSLSLINAPAWSSEFTRGVEISEERVLVYSLSSVVLAAEGAVAYIFIPQVSIIGGAVTGGVLVAGSTLDISIQESQKATLANIVRNDIQNYRMGGELSTSLAQSLKQLQNISDMSEADAIALIETSSEQL